MSSAIGKSSSLSDDISMEMEIEMLLFSGYNIFLYDMDMRYETENRTIIIYLMHSVIQQFFPLLFMDLIFNILILKCISSAYILKSEFEFPVVDYFLFETVGVNIIHYYRVLII